MLHYFYLLNRTWFEASFRPAVSECWRRRRFSPCLDLCRELSARRALPEDAVLRRLRDDWPFDRALWRALVDECLIFGAAAMPRLPCHLEAMQCLLAPARIGLDTNERSDLVAIEQVYLGSRDLRFAGGWHRPEQVGWNAAADVARLADYLGSVDTGVWIAADLTPLRELPDPSEREEELAYLRAEWPALVEMYQQARAAEQVIVCERT